MNNNGPVLPLALVTVMVWASSLALIMVSISLSVLALVLVSALVSYSCISDGVSIGNCLHE